MAVQPPHKSLQCFLRLSSHHFFPLSWGPFPKKKFSRDPTFSHYLGGPSPQKFLQRSYFFPLSWGPFPQKNLKRSQVFPLSWWSFPKKNSQEIPGFPTILVVLPPKKCPEIPGFPTILVVLPQNKSPEIPGFPTILVVLPQKKFSRDPRFSHYLGGPSPKKNSQETPGFPTILVVLPQKKFSRDPTFSHYLGGPSPKKFLQRSYFFPLSWGPFPQKISRDPRFSHYLGGPSPKTILKRSQVFLLSWWSFPQKNVQISHYLGCPPQKKRHQGWGSHRSWGACSFLQKKHMAFQPPPNKNKTHGFPATTLHKQNKWLSSHHTKKQVNMALQPSNMKKKPAPIFTFLFFLSVGRVPCLLRGLWLSSQQFQPPSTPPSTPCRSLLHAPSSAASASSLSWKASTPGILLPCSSCSQQHAWYAVCSRT